jgi:hypothetical protein
MGANSVDGDLDVSKQVSTGKQAAMGIGPLIGVYCRLKSLFNNQTL